MCVGLTKEAMWAGYDFLILGVLIKDFMYQFCHKMLFLWWWS
jgi:hypothetical protein